MRGQRRLRWRAALAMVGALAMVLPAAAASAQTSDPREGLEAGVFDAEEASWNMDLIESLPKPLGFYDPNNWGAAAYRNSDMSFAQDHVFVGQYNGALIYDVTDPTSPELRTAIVCPGGQGDISVHGDLMFISVQELGTEECQLRGEGTTTLNGMRVFDISDLDNPQQVATVQTCRGSHTHALVAPPDDDETVYIYVHGTSGVRSDTVEGLECVVGPIDPATGRPSTNPDHFEPGTETDRYQIEVIEVPIDRPQDAELVSEPRIFQDYETGHPVGLRGNTNACHDITTFPELGIAAGACQGNGLLLDISDPVNPIRIDDVENPEFFAYWHSATFNNDGTSVVFTDELGGGGGAICQPTSGRQFGANAIYEIDWSGDHPVLLDGEDAPTYFKPPDVQTATENCVAHNGNLLPVPGRDIMVQAWYQGGISVFDFTDPNDPFEIAFFDRGPIDAERLVLGGHWSAYYYNGYIYGSEIVRGLDVLELTPSEHLSQEELDAAAAVRLRDHFPQMQTRITDGDRSACAQVDGAGFPDIPYAVHRSNIECVRGFGIVEGHHDGTFRPADNVRRDHMAAFIHRMMRTAGVDMPDVGNRFADISTNSHRQAISELAELGVIQGTTATTYSPADDVTREQMTSLIVRAAEYVLDTELASPRSPFSDVPSGGTHTEAIDKAHAAGLVNGVTATTFQPRESIRRDQMGSLLARSLELYHYELVELEPLG